MTGDTAPEDALARRCAEAMYAGDRASQALGMRLEWVAAGAACMTMTLRPDMLNGHGSGHGGLIFSLADSTFAFACNSYNQVTVAESCHIAFLAPARGGDLLTAIAREVVREGRNGLYDVRVTNQDSRVIAEFRGKSRTLSGALVDGDADQDREKT